MSYNKGGYGGRGGGNYIGNNRGMYGGGRGGGGYRGRGSDTWRSSRGGGMGGPGGNSYGNTRGRFGGGGYSSNPYDHRKTNYGSGDRYAGSSRSREDQYRSYQDDYSGGREFQRVSPDPPKKRQRTYSPQQYMGSSRRSNERSFSSGGDYMNRSYYGGDKGPSPTDKGTTYREVREVRSSEFSFRKPGMSGRLSGYRGARRGLGRRGGSFLSVRRDNYTIRKRLIPSRQRDYVRRLKQFRKRYVGKSDEEKESGDEDDEKVDSESDEDDIEGEEEEERDEVSSQEGAENEGDGEGEEGEDEKKDDAEGEEDGKEDDEEDGKEDDEEEGGEGEERAKEPAPGKEVKKKKAKKVVAKKSAKPKDTKKEEGDESGKEESKEGEGDDKKKTAASTVPSNFLKLKCPHCKFTSQTFRDYARHLGGRKHDMSMQRLSQRLKSDLHTMRVEQRKNQKALDEEALEVNPRLRTYFCTICQLNYRTLKTQHTSSFYHKTMREFLMPYCKVCRASFKTPLSYEAHLCELLHIKRKARLDKIRAPRDEDQVMDLDTSSFMVLDSVGSGDEDSDLEEGDKAEANEGEADGEKKEGDKEKKTKKKSEIKLGSEFCKMVQVYFCELCKIYLSRVEDTEKALIAHCRSRTHLQRFVRYRDDQNLRRKAVRIHKLREKARKSKLASTQSSQDETKKEDKDEEEKGVENEEEKEEEQEEERKEEEGKKSKKEDEEEGSLEMDDGDKMWSEVDKDLSELLSEDKRESDDEGRFDKFKSVETKGESGTAQANGSLSPKTKVSGEA